MKRAPIAALLVALAAAPSRASSAAPEPIRHDLRVDGAVAGAAAAGWIGSELAKRWLAPSSCRICETNGLDSGARDLLVWGYDGVARRTSDVLAFAVVPGAVAAHQLLAARAAGDTDEGWVDLLVVAEATALAADAVQLLKYSVGRQRPFVRYGNWRDANRKPDADDNVSFPSGHTALAFSLATAAGTVSSLRGYRSAPWVWGVGLGAAATIGYLRIAGDKHYLTDVLAGAAIGTAVGITVPRAFHGREKREAGSAAVLPIPLGFVVLF